MAEGEVVVIAATGARVAVVALVGLHTLLKIVEDVVVNRNVVSLVVNTDPITEASPVLRVPLSHCPGTVTLISLGTKLIQGNLDVLRHRGGPATVHENSVGLGILVARSIGTGRVHAMYVIVADNKMISASRYIDKPAAATTSGRLLAVPLQVRNRLSRTASGSDA